jgi:hypothetical protein
VTGCPNSPPELLNASGSALLGRMPICSLWKFKVAHYHASALLAKEPIGGLNFGAMRWNEIVAASMSKPQWMFRRALGPDGRGYVRCKGRLRIEGSGQPNAKGLY